LYVFVCPATFPRIYALQNSRQSASANVIVCELRDLAVQVIEKINVNIPHPIAAGGVLGVTVQLPTLRREKCTA
jgi:uncharacterized protein YbaR (Trm112 family)